MAHEGNLIRWQVLHSYLSVVNVESALLVIDLPLLPVSQNEKAWQGKDISSF